MHRDENSWYKMYLRLQSACMPWLQVSARRLRKVQVLPVACLWSFTGFFFWDGDMLGFFFW